MLDEPGVEGEYHQGVEGDAILVNGSPWPVLDVSTTRYRFRLLNVSNARRFRLRLDPTPPEGSCSCRWAVTSGCSPHPQELDVFAIAPAERADVVIDFAAYPVDTEVTLVNRLGNGATRDVMRFRISRRESDDSQVPVDARGRGAARSSTGRTAATVRLPPHDSGI